MLVLVYQDRATAVNGGVLIYLWLTRSGSEEQFHYTGRCCQNWEAATSTNFPTNLQPVLPLFSQYKVIVLGDREFCSIDLGKWLKEKGVSFCLRLKKNHCIETEHLVWRRLHEVGILLWNL